MQQTLSTGHPLSGLLAMVTVAAAVWAFPISLVLLRLYRRRVIDTMMTRATPETGPTAPSDSPAGVAGPVRGGPRAAGLAPIAGELHETARRRAWRAASVHGAAGLAFAVVMALSYMSREGSGFHLMTLLVVTWPFAWPAVLSIALVTAGSRGEQAGLAAAYFGVLALIGAGALLVSDSLTVGQLVLLWVVLNVPGTLLIALCLSRPVRAVGPLVLGFLLIATFGAALAMVLTATAEVVPRILGEIGAALGLGAPLLILGMVLAGAAVLSPLGYINGRWLGQVYDRKRISDQSITIDALWLVFAVTHSTVLVAGGGPTWLLSGALAFAAYRTVATLGFRALRRRAGDGGPAPRLLVLRAFSLGSRSERLFSALTKRWRHVGSVQLIAGPDLATTTIEPHEFLDFLHGRLARRFIEGPQSLDRAMADMDLAPDPDGRFRVNEFFCYEDVWRLVFARLLAVSDAVLMDLRGFSRASPGLAFEVRELVRTAPLERVVLLVDHQTERDYLDELVGEAWRERGAGGDPRPPALGLVPVRSTRGDRDALQALSTAVRPARQPA